MTVNGYVNRSEHKGDYDISESESNSKTKSIGQLKLDGDWDTSTIGENDFISYASSKNVNFYYSFNSKVLNRKDTKWHIVEDKAKEVDSIELEDKIQNGVVIIQTSTDGDKWITQQSSTNYFSSETDINKSLYETSSMQLTNGCYFRVIVAYKMERVTGSKKVLFVNRDQKENKRVTEVYSFFLQGNNQDETTYTTEPRMELGQKVNAGKDTGYSETNDIDIDDPHYGWDLGSFSINGYTDETDDNGTPVFLKNVGDKTTLWFTLTQDINQLNGDETLSIAEDKNGYNKEFEVNQTNFKHGALIIQYTNSSNHKETPIVYTDFLAANASLQADTKVQLFEEGDYTVSLNYEIKKDSRNVAGVSILPEYNDYAITFSFKVRNSNCMVFPFDLDTGDELSDYAIAEKGFKLDLANSKYLKINVKKSSIKENEEGTISTDERSNKVSKDNATFEDEGVYVFTVQNEYTNEETTKTIFVGDNKCLKAMSRNHLSIDELNTKIRNGSTIKKDGSIEG